jgi:hypothetical protein
MDEQAPTSAPKRRWSQFSMRFLLLGITVVACLLVWAPWEHDPEEWIGIAKVGSSDTANAMVALLEANGIESGHEGSIHYMVYVQRRHAPRACELIRNAGPQLGPYQIWIATY